MAYQKSPEDVSPSASSIFLPLGRRGSRTSLSTQAERENLNEALNQIHSAAYQSDCLTVFNEFTQPPSSTVAAENTTQTNDLHGGLSGLYSRFRASVGGVKDIVGGSGRPSDGTSIESPTTKSPSADNTSFTGLESQPSHPNSVPGSKIHSPVVGTFSSVTDSFNQGTIPRGPRLSSKPASVSSKASASSTPAVKSPIPALTKTANPMIAETNVNAVRDGIINPKGSSGGLSHTFQSGDQPDLDRTEGSLRSSLSEGSVGPNSQRSYSPVLIGKAFNNSHRDGQGLPDSVQRQPTGSDISVHDKLNKAESATVGRYDLLELDTSFSSASRRAKLHHNTGQETQSSSQGNITTASSSSFTADESTVPTSATNSLIKITNNESSSIQDGRTPTTLGTSVSLTDRDSSSANPSRRDKLATRVSQSRLPGYVMSHASSSETAMTQSSIYEHFSEQPYRSRIAASRGSEYQQNAFTQLRSKLLSKEFWMRDENAKDCFLCGEPFTTFRRKHHCRTCGQIFDSKCTVLIPGVEFGQSGSIRVCRPCEDMINSRDDDSSDFSDNELSPIVFDHRLPELQTTGISGRLLGDDDDTSSIMSQSIEHVLKTPTMAIPATRRTAEGSNRRSAVLEIDSDRPLARPTSSRSLRSSAGLRNHPMGHKRHHSRQQYIRSFKSYHEDRAPFQRRHLEDLNHGTRLPAFHRDSIIDPDLAQYLSDDASSGDEQPNILSVVSDGSLSKNAADNERATFGSLLAAVKKSRSRFGDRSTTNGVISTRDADDGSISSSRAVNLPRPARRRNLSVASSIHQRTSPRASKDNTLILHEHPSPGTTHHTGAALKSGFKMTRSSSMRGAGAPAVELNKASLEHVRKLLRQLLKDSAVPHASSWETALLPILLKATDEVDPDVQRGDDMDIRHYVKLKKIPGGRPGDTSYVSGLVFTKNLALKSMPRSIPRPKILIITFALEYARHQQHFMSLEPVIRQQREFLENLVSRIAALGPNLLLVEKNVSGLALELLEKANIATAYNVKPSVLEAVSRCTQTRIITSMDKLVTTPAHAGHCGSFDLKTYVHGGRRKTYMYISGCPQELGCTIVLRGADNDSLIKVKRVTEFMVYVVYNLKLETCLMRDEFAQLPTASDSVKRGIQNGDSAGASKLVTSNDHIADQKATQSDTVEKVRDGGVADPAITTVETEVPDDVPMPTFYEDMVEKHETKILSASPCVKFEPPYLLMRARELERRLAYLKRLRDRALAVEQSQDEKSKSQKFLLITPEMVHESPGSAPVKVKEVLHAVHDAEYDRALHNYQTQKRQWEAYLSGNPNLFDPYAHQNIVVLYSLVCTTTSIPCSGPDIFALDFYNEHDSENSVFETDCTLGQYVEDLCLEADHVCTANGCENRMFEHHRQYVHGEAQISIFVQPYPCKLRGLQDTILMWSCCKICGNETQVIPMSENTWRYSFGKYLELSFWSRDVRVRAGVCPHNIHRDHLRYFGFKDMALRIHYDSITLLEIIVPRTRVTWKVDNDLRLRNEIYKKSEHRIIKFMASVKARLKSINVESVMPEKVEDCREETEVLMKKANEDHVSLVKQLQEKYMNSRYWEILPLNEILRSIQEKVVEWDTAFAEFEKNFFPSEKDIRRLATLQLKKIFLDKDVSVTSLTSTEEPPTTPTEPGADEEHNRTEDPRPVRRMTLLPEKAQDVLVSVVEEHSGRINMDGIDGSTENGLPAQPHAENQVSTPLPNPTTEEEVQHLDLAVPSSLTEEDMTSRRPSVEALPGSRSATPSVNSDFRLSNPPSPEQLVLPERIQRMSSGSWTDINKSGPQPVQTPSGIPRLADSGARRGGKARSPPLFRAYSQPVHLLREKNNTGPMAALKSGFGNNNSKVSGPLPSPPVFDSKSKFGDKKFSERLGLSALKSGKLASGHSLIPRSIPNKKKNPRVSNLARHFEQLSREFSREFEKERQRERLQRAARSKHSRAYPIASSKPIVEVYKNVREAVEEREPSGEGEDFFSTKVPSSVEESTRESEELFRTDTNLSKEPIPEEVPEMPAEPEESTRLEKDTSEVEDGHSDDNLQLPDSPEELAKLSPDDEIDLKELPKHERNTLVRMMTNFWAERSASGWQPLDYPLKVSDHVFADCAIIVREDEPSSLIAFALDSHDYTNKLASIQDSYEKLDKQQAALEGDMEAQNEARVEHALLRATGTHLKYQFQEGQAKMLCKIFYAEQFDALRRKCGVADRIVESLSRCAKWDSKGGKTKSLFLKTLDDRFVLKSLSAIETQAFLKFAPAYFQIMSEALFHELPSAIAKMFGFYQVIIKNPATGVEFNWFLLLMENLFYDRVPTRIFDLKGSMRNRKVQSTGERNEVLLDENMVDFIYESPLFTREHSKKLLSQSVWNDTLFLGRQNVMDYSLMIAIDEPREELVVGIIDCIRTYTWDKKLESWIKDRGFAGGGKNRPTVTSPKEYKSRFREAMARYVLQAPNCWHQFQSTYMDHRQIEGHLHHVQAVADMENGNGESTANGEV